MPIYYSEWVLFIINQLLAYIVLLMQVVDDHVIEGASLDAARLRDGMRLITRSKKVVTVTRLDGGAMLFEALFYENHAILSKYCCKLMKKHRNNVMGDTKVCLHYP